MLTSSAKLKKTFLFIDLREREEGGEREKTLTCCSTYSCIHWSNLACALTGDQTHSLGVNTQYSDRLSHLARALLPNLREEVLKSPPQLSNQDK